MAEIDLGEIGADDGAMLDLGTKPKAPPVMTTPQQILEKDIAANTTPFGRFMGGVGYGMEQTYLQGKSLLPFTDKNTLRQQMLENQQIYEAMKSPNRGSMAPSAAGMGNLFGSVAATAPLMLVPGGQTSLPARMAVAGGVGGVIGALQPAQSGVETLKNTLMGVGFGGAMPVAEQFLVQPTISKLAQLGRPSTVSTVVEREMNKAAKPAFSSQQTAPQRKEYFAKAREAVDTIIENKPNLTFVDEFGDITTGRLPETLSEFADTLHQTKRSIFQQYDDMVKQATGQGVQVPVANTVNSVAKEVAKGKYALSPELRDYAEKQIVLLNKKDSFSPQDAQDVVANFNQSLKMFLDNPSKQTQGQAIVDALIAGGLREELNNTMEMAGQSGYQALKSKYGALKAIEKDVNKQASVQNRKNAAGFFDVTDTYSAQHAAMALMKMDPAGLTAAGFANAVKRLLKHMNNPDRAVKRLFSSVERYNAKRPAPVAPMVDETQKLLPPGQGFTMKPYMPDEVIPPQQGGVIPPERRLYGPTVSPEPSQAALPSPGRTSDVQQINAGWTPKYSPGPKPGVFTMSGPQGKVDMDIQHAAYKLREMGYSEYEINNFLTNMMKSGKK